MLPLSYLALIKSSIKLVRNPVMHARAKHIKLEHHYIKEMNQAWDLVAMCIPTRHQVMDLLTKPLGWVNHAAQWMLGDIGKFDIVLPTK
jgi:hypothetical protein